jgi:hypothetical protein
LLVFFSRFTLVSIHHIISFQLFYKYSLSLSFSLVSFSSFVLCCLFVRKSHPSDDFLLLYVCTLVLLMLWNPSPFLRTKLFDTVRPTMGSVRSTWLFTAVVQLLSDQCGLFSVSHRLMAPKC